MRDREPKRMMRLLSRIAERQRREADSQEKARHVSLSWVDPASQFASRAVDTLGCGLEAGKAGESGAVSIP